MKFIAFAVAFLFAAEGIFEIVCPRRIKEMLKEIHEIIPVKPTGLLYCFLGVSLNFAARMSSWNVFVAVIGSIFFVMGFAAFFIPKETAVKLLSRISEAPNYMLRIWGFLILSVGIGLFFAL